MYYFQWFLEIFYVQASVRAVNANIKTIIIQVNDIPGYKLVYFNHFLWFMLLKLLIVNFIYISISSIVNKFSLLCSLKKSCFLVEIKISIILYKRWRFSMYNFQWFLETFDAQISC